MKRISIKHVSNGWVLDVKDNSFYGNDEAFVETTVDGLKQRFGDIMFHHYMDQTCNGEYIDLTLE